MNTNSPDRQRRRRRLQALAGHPRTTATARARISAALGHDAAEVPVAAPRERGTA